MSSFPSLSTAALFRSASERGGGSCVSDYGELSSPDFSPPPSPLLSADAFGPNLISHLLSKNGSIERSMSLPISPLPPSLSSSLSKPAFPSPWQEQAKLAKEEEHGPDFSSLSSENANSKLRRFTSPIKTKEQVRNDPGIYEASGSAYFVQDEEWDDDQLKVSCYMDKGCKKIEWKFIDLFNTQAFKTDILPAVYASEMSPEPVHIRMTGRHKHLDKVSLLEQRALAEAAITAATEAAATAVALAGEQDDATQGGGEEGGGGGEIEGGGGGEIEGGVGAAVVSRMLFIGQLLTPFLASNLNLVALDLAMGDDGTELALGLAKNRSITDLNLSRNAISTVGATALSKALARNTVLRRLNLSQNVLHHTAGSALAPLCAHKSLRYLNLNVNKIGAQGAKMLAKALSSKDCVLEELHLTNNRLGAEGIGYLCNSIEKHTTLKVFCAALNDIEHEGSLAVASMLKVNKALTMLDLSDNHIGSLGCATIMEALQMNTTLLNLQFAFNRVGLDVLNEFDDSEHFVGVEAVGQMLAKNSKLENLNLTGNFIVDGVRFLSEGLAQSSSLLSFNVSRNDISSPGCMLLLRSLERRRNPLPYLDMSRCAIGPDGGNSIAHFLRLKQTIQHLDISGNAIGTEGLFTIINEYEQHPLSFSLSLEKYIIYKSAKLRTRYHRVMSKKLAKIIFKNFQLPWDLTDIIIGYYCQNKAMNWCVGFEKS